MNKINHLVYVNILKPIFFRFDPEDVHERMTKLGIFLGKHYLARKLIHTMFFYSNKKLSQNILGINFQNPIGLSAGFDKNAVLTDILPHIGFGFAEVGSITGEKCEGNPKPRLWRLKKSKSLAVYYGLKNDGSDAISKRLKNKKFIMPIGISIAKTNCMETVDVNNGIADYVKAYKNFAGIGDYDTINISCPNTYGGEPFTNPDNLDKLLTEIDKIKSDKVKSDRIKSDNIKLNMKKSKPLFLKISPDLTDDNIDKLIEIVKKHKVDGFVCTNLTKKRDNKRIIDENVPEKGGLSGKVVEEQSNKLIKYIFKKTKGRYVIIGVGGVFTAEDAYKKIKSGASLIQLITGMIYEGPQVISEINIGLVKLLEKDGYSNISEAVGKGAN